MGNFSRRQFLLSLSAVSGAGLLAACMNEEDAQNAVSGEIGNDIYTPDGKLEHYIEPADREEPLSFGGESLMEEGDQLQLSDFAGQIVVVNAWGQWCAPCRAEIDDLQQVHEELQSRNLGTLLGINVRDYNPQIARDFIEDNGVTFPSIYDPPFKTAASLGGIPPSVIPSTVILDEDHRQAAVFIRPIVASELLDVIDRLSEE
ncbi:Thiol-disulfide isomerase-like thioredoxin [Corynebacterium camporealensis]|uniref:Thiol-disulfide isomerase-like thioredoxin n=2 Tax=Corynebacterium camporealensis TaxID=161896 RepID=A0A0F6TAI0_9CORY|nr:thiol-disulfide isomerase-like thioredoxin [Corynebacterium camporealensis]AVH87570.1 Thiol-disulfide isomerase-like thioredoxin [Corynebacterium camporealensis]